MQQLYINYLIQKHRQLPQIKSTGSHMVLNPTSNTDVLMDDRNMRNHHNIWAGLLVLKVIVSTSPAVSNPAEQDSYVQNPS